MPTVRAPETTAEVLLSDRPDEHAIDAYQAAGAIIVRGLIGPEWIESLRACYGGLADSATVPYAKGPDARRKDLPTSRAGMWEEEARFRAFLFESPIARAAAVLMRSRTAQLYEDILITSPAGHPPRSGWHQDEPTWPVRGKQLSSVWMALEPVGDESGAMRFVRASHQGPLYRPGRISAEEAGDDVQFWTGGAFPDVDGAPDQHTIAQTDTRPGDVVVFHPRAIHTAYGSAPDYARRTFTIRFMGDDVRWLPKKRLFHPWMHELGLKEGDVIENPRLPMVWRADAA